MEGRGLAHLQEDPGYSTIVQITAVEPRSAAARCGLRAGDGLLAINDLPLRDAIDVQVYASEAELRLLYERDGQRRTCSVKRRYGEPLGLSFAELLFDSQTRTCRNACDFCFVAQMAPGLRSPLYIRDDDFRLSFLQGNYVSLTNLNGEDWERIEEQFLSPLYVSVHATDPEVRVGLMHNPRAGQIIEHLQRLAQLGIQMHTQAVLVPGRNDGACLDRTIAELAALHPAVVDLSVVPVGVTRWHKPSVRPYSDSEAVRVLKQVLGWRDRLRQRLGINFVYPSDEWFLRAGVAVPAPEDYDGLLPNLIENGVGMVSSFASGWPALQERLASLGGRTQTWVSGALFAPLLKGYAARFTEVTGIRAEVVVVANRVFGETVTVAGLLTVGDVATALQGVDLGDLIVCPAEMFRGPDGVALDGRSAEDLRAMVGTQVAVFSSA